tara:strand:- start:179 stop:2119 length:1941 start_codon:yes stop_codon:yes gene_type:complete
MALNPFFLQGSQSEQRLIQELINEQLTIYGVEVIYLPRKIVNQDTVLNEIQSSKFDDNFAIEAYVNTYEGYGGAGDIMTKFGMSLKDELTVTISRERYEDFIAPFLGELDANNDDEINVASRPREGDLIYFPLGRRLFEVKFVEHEQPFYQLGKNYVYQLKCELFEYSDELGGWDQLSTTTEEIDSVLEDQGYITSIVMIGSGTTAQTIAHTGTGYVREIFLNNDGYGYTSTPTVSISTSPNGNPLSNAEAIAITTTSGNIKSVKEIVLTNAGFGYTEAPTISIVGGGGTDAMATCSVETTEFGIIRFSILEGGSGYPIAPVVTIDTTGPGAAATSTVGSDGTITGFTLSTGGKFYGTSPTVTIANPPTRTGVVSTLQATDVGGTPTLPLGSGYSNGTFETSGGTGTGLKVEVSVNTGTTTIGENPTVIYSGHGYSVNDVVQIVGGNNDAYIKVTAVTTGIGSTATANSVLTNDVVTGLTITNPGSGYTTPPTVSIANTSGDKDYSPTGLTTAIVRANVSTANTVSSIHIVNPGFGYSPAQPVTIADPPTTGIGTFVFNELVTGSISGAKARVKTWNKTDKILKVGTTNGTFVPGDVIVGSASSAKYSVDFIQSAEFSDKYDKGDEIETSADTFLDFTESNPFGTY